MNTKNYPKLWHWITVLPLLCYILAIIFNAQADRTSSLLSLELILLFVVAFIGLVLAYKQQWIFLKKDYPKRFKNQFIFVGAALIFPMVATILGDIHGSIAFENSGFITQNGLITGFTVGLFLGANALYLCTLENVFFILGNGKNKFVQACEYIIEGLAWLAIFAISYFSYALTYTLHDPSTE